MKNAEWMIKNGMEFSRLTWAHINGRNIVHYRKNKSIAIEIYSEKSVNPENLITKWLDMEHKEPILDDVEKRYLSAVIRPFRNNVDYISKHRCNSGSAEFIMIKFKRMIECENRFYFPPFKSGTMYKGMKPYEIYTLEELGL